MVVLSSVETCIERACRTAATARGGVLPRVVGVGITNQRETTVLWHKSTGKPLHNAIVWLDTRTQALIDRLSDGNKDRLRASCGLPLSTFVSYLLLLFVVVVVRLCISLRVCVRACVLPNIGDRYPSAGKFLWLLTNVPAVRAAVDADLCLFGTIDTWLIWVRP